MRVSGGGEEDMFHFQLKTFRNVHHFDIFQANLIILYLFSTYVPHPIPNLHSKSPD